MTTIVDPRECTVFSHGDCSGERVLVVLPDDTQFPLCLGGDVEETELLAVLISRFISVNHMYDSVALVLAKS